ncbi:hypothetical protein BDR22DRAFT_853321 [Usnea florida]
MSRGTMVTSDEKTSLSPVAEREIYFHQHSLIFPISSAPKCNLAAINRLKSNVVTRFRVI